MSIYHISATLALVIITACGGSGSGVNSTTNGNATIGGLTLLSHTPADLEMQVDVHAAIQLIFDKGVVIESLRDQDTHLRTEDSETNIEGTLRLAENDRAVSFTPVAPLALEANYVFQLSALTCDAEGHLLDTQYQFSFRTLDNTAPTIQSSNLTGQQNRSRSTAIQVTFSEPLDIASLTANTVQLIDTFGQTYNCRREIAANTISITPQAELPGDRNFTLTLGTGLRDLAGNTLAVAFTSSFRTDSDFTSPSVFGAWPAVGALHISPSVEPVIEFSESMDPATVEPASVFFHDEFGSQVAFTVIANENQHTLRLKPLQNLSANRSFEITFLTGIAAVTDVSGNPLTATQALSFSTGTDTTTPWIVQALPSSNENRVSINVVPLITFNEALDTEWIDGDTVALFCGNERTAAVVQQLASNTIRLTPLLRLLPYKSYQVVLSGGHQGIRDLAGNVLPEDLAFPFATANDNSLPSAMLQPYNGSAGVPSTIHASIVFDSRIDPSTVSAATCELRMDNGVPVVATVALDTSNRVIGITPASALVPGYYYRTFVRGGPLGVRESSGNWLANDLNARFRVGAGIDNTPPTVNVQINRIAQSRSTGLIVPTSGFTIDVTASDAEQSLDMGSTKIRFTGSGTAPFAAELLANAAIGYNSVHLTVPLESAITRGAWSVSVEVADLSGNRGTSQSLQLQVDEPSSEALPFETTQVVWVRTDLDRDGNGRSDFDDDLYRMGLATEGDNAGTNSQVQKLMRDAIVTRASNLFGRAADGEPLGPDSIQVRITTRAPGAIRHMEIALGGYDPEGNRNRVYGATSTGILGRAYFDYRNANMNDRNLATSPGLGVFPGEMWLYQAKLHQQLYPSFLTMFAQRFLPLCPAMGGTPAGSHPADPVVLRASFQPSTANSEQLARFNVLMQAIDDWAMVNGTVLAHEIGHSLGLVAPGPAPNGLFGDSSLHDDNAGATEVMAASVGYESMVTLSYAFRDIELAYLRQRLILR